MAAVRVVVVVVVVAVAGGAGRLQVVMLLCSRCRVHRGFKTSLAWPARLSLASQV